MIFASMKYNFLLCMNRITDGILYVVIMVRAGSQMKTNEIIIPMLPKIKEAFIM